MKFLVLTVLLALTTKLATADVIINNNDSSGEGFNDPAPFSAVGGNAAHTLGQARLNAFRHAGLMIDAMVSSPVPIRVSAEMNSMGGNATSAPLGGAGPVEVFKDFPGAPRASTWYVGALANALRGSDLSTSDEIRAQFNTDVDGDVVLGNARWYYGYDKPVTLDLEFLPVVRHEIIHGLGFLTLVESDGRRLNGFDDAYMVYLEDHSLGATFPSMTDTQRAAAMVDNGDLHWTGPEVLANSGFLTDGTSSGHVRMYAPTSYTAGSSVSHFDITLAPDELMEPFLTSNPVSILAAALLDDIGWTVLNNAPTLPNGNISVSSQITGTSGQTSSIEVTATNTTAGSVPNATLELIVPSNTTVSNLTPSSGSCQAIDSLIRCNLGNLPASSSSATLTLDLTINDAAETTYTFNLSSPLFDTNMANNQVDVTINPPPVIPDISALDTQATEGDLGDITALTFTVSLNAATNQDVSVDYSTTENTASATFDYLDTSGSLTITAGNTTGTVLVTIIPDNDIENNEALTLNISNASYGNIVRANANGVIIDDDLPTPAISSGGSSGGGGGTGLFLLGLLPLLLIRHLRAQ